MAHTYPYLFMHILMSGWLISGLFKVTVSLSFLFLEWVNLDLRYVIRSYRAVYKTVYRLYPGHILLHHHVQLVFTLYYFCVLVAKWINNSYKTVRGGRFFCCFFISSRRWQKCGTISHAAGTGVGLDSAGTKWGSNPQSRFCRLRSGRCSDLGLLSPLLFIRQRRVIITFH